MYLLRKCADVPYENIIIPIIEDKYGKWVEELREQTTIASMSSDLKRIWLVSEASNNCGIIGLVNCLRQEPGGSSIRCVFKCKDTPNLPEFNLKSQFYQDIALKDLTMNVFQRGSWGSYRHLSMSEDHWKVETKHAYLNVLTRGDLSSLVWVDSPLKYFKETPNSILCHVYYASLNFRDVMLASGKLPPDALPGDLALQECLLGLEISGRLENGQRVMALVPAKGLSTSVSADPYFVWEVPDDWSLEEASTVPVAYSTAFYALIMRGNLRKGERVLIHSGSGAVGQAAIAIALSLGCEVFTTVGSSVKREFLKKRFSELGDRNFCKSRDTSFEQYILHATNGEGVDVVLNSLAEEKLKASLNCLAQDGRFLEIGKHDLSNNTPLGMAIFLKNISFHGILLDTLFENKSSSLRTKKELVQLVKDSISNGTVKPLNSVLFDRDEAEQAFRFMASGKHIGKVVLKIRDEEPQKKIVPTPVQLIALSRIACSPGKSYVIIGGLGGFGLELCQWLIERGARHIVLTSRSGLKTGYQKLCLNRWRKENINVIVSNLNATKMNEAKALLKEAEEVKPVVAIFNLALVLRDAFIENQTVKDFKEVCESKVTSTLNLDAASRELRPELEWFVCFSSMSCVRGIAGQSNYGYAYSAMERICEERSKEGLPGLAIQWGIIGDVGVIRDTLGSDVVIASIIPQRINSCLTALEKFLQQNNPVVSSFVPYKLSETSIQKTAKHNVLSTIGKIFGIEDLSAINQEISLGELGMDSLMAVEVKQFLERDLDLVLMIPELRQLKVKDLKKLEGTGDKTMTATSPKSKIKPTTDFRSESKSKVADKIAGHFRSLTSKELVPSETIIKMNSEKTGIPLFIVHPIEGTVAMLKSLSQLLNLPVYGIQCTPEAPLESIEELASWYWKHIKETNISNTICLAGYSYGGTVAFEMCLQAERDPQQHPEVRNLIMLDGSPAFLSAYTRDHKLYSRSDSIAEDEVQVLCLYVLQFMDIIMMDFKKELETLPSLADRIKKSFEKISFPYKNLQPEDLTVAFDLYYKKILMSVKYIPRHKLKKEIALIKASDSLDMTENISATYDLEKVCDGKIIVHTVKGTHKHFILDKGAKEVSRLISGITSS